MVSDASVTRAMRALAAGVALAGSSVAGAQGRAATLSVAGRSSDNVSMAARGRFVVVVWSAAATGVTDIYAAASRDGGVTFTPPVRVNATPGEARVNGEMPPRAALIPRGAGGEPEVAVVWTMKGDKAWRLLIARSSDGVRSFGASEMVPGTDGPGNRGWESVAVDPQGRVVVAWLDHREMEAGTGAEKDKGAPGAMRHATHDMGESERKAGLSQLYVTTVGVGAPRGIARSVCYCCKTSLVADGKDVYAVWRHVFPGNERDIAMATSRDGGARFSAPTRVSADRWTFDGCPDNGPALAIDGSRRAHVLWVTPKAGGDVSQMELYHAATNDGRTFTARTRIPTRGLPGHAQAIAEPRGDLVVAWDEIGGGARRVMLGRISVDPAGRARFAPLAAPEPGEGHHPVVATTDAATLVAWVRRPAPGEESTIGVARVQ